MNCTRFIHVCFVFSLIINFNLHRGPVPDHLWTKIYQHKHPQSARNRTYRHSTALIEISTSNNLFGFHNTLLHPLPNSTLNVSTYFYKNINHLALDTKNGLNMSRIQHCGKSKKRFCRSKIHTRKKECLLKA